MSPEIAMFALNAVKGIGAGITEEARVNANNVISEANTYAQNLVRKANNDLGKARAGTSRYIQSVNNQRLLESTGNAATAAGMTYRRARDGAVKDDFESQIAFAEQAGNQRAQAALSGLTGGVADIVEATTRLRKNRLQQRSDELMKFGDYDAGQRQKAILQAGWDSLDSSEINADTDHSVNIATKQVYQGNLLSEVLGSVDGKGAANLLSKAGTFFKKQSFGETIPMQPGGGY